MGDEVWIWILDGVYDDSQLPEMEMRLNFSEMVAQGEGQGSGRGSAGRQLEEWEETAQSSGAAKGGRAGRDDACQEAGCQEGEELESVVKFELVAVPHRVGHVGKHDGDSGVLLCVMPHFLLSKYFAS